jgi:hypothetical protein
MSVPIRRTSPFKHGKANVFESIDAYVRGRLRSIPGESETKRKGAAAEAITNSAMITRTGAGCFAVTISSDLKGYLLQVKRDFSVSAFSRR